MPTRATASRTLLIVCVCVLSLFVCCGLAWWQWDRFTSGGGSFQNLGYVLQWPLFGLFPAFMFWRMHKLRLQAKAAGEQRREPSADEETVAPRPRGNAARAAAARRSAAAPRPLVDEPLDHEDAVLAEYNAYLAELNASEQERN